MFDTAEDATKLYQTYADLLHHFVAQLLHLSMQAQPDIQLTVYSIYNRVKESDIYDYKKLARVMKYIQGTIGLPMIQSINKYGNKKWYVDAEFLVHTDMRSHTGGFITTGTGGAYVKYRKKLNAKSSTEAKLVGVHNILTQVILT